MRYADLVDDATKHDRSRTWTAKRCAAIATELNALADAGHHPRSARLRAAKIYRFCGDARAIEAFEQFVRLYPSHLSARMSLALLHTRQGNHDKAALLAQRALKDSKGTREALATLADVLIERNAPGDLERATSLASTALASDDTFVPAHEQLAHAIIRATFDGRAFGLAPAAARPALKRALLICREGLERIPSYAPLQHLAGLLHQTLGEPMAARRAFDQARQSDPYLFEAHLSAGSINIRYGAFGHAEKALRTAVHLRPKSYDARVALATAVVGLVDEANKDESVRNAERLLRSAIASHPERPKAYFSLATLIYEQAPAFEPQRAESFERAMLRNRMHNEAHKLYLKFLERAQRQPDRFPEAMAVARMRTSGLPVPGAVEPNVKGR